MHMNYCLDHSAEQGKHSSKYLNDIFLADDIIFTKVTLVGQRIREYMV
jgi:hypothetical protein